MKYTEKIARNTKNTKILTEILRREKDDYVSCDAAKNPNCPKEMLAEVLRRERDDYVSRFAASNLNCPPEMLTEILKRGKDDYVSRSAALNPNCPPENLVEILKRNNDDDVSYYAAKNPNCPKDAKRKWKNNIKSIKKIQDWILKSNASLEWLIETQKKISETLKNIEK